MTPHYKLLANNQDITKIIADRMLSITLVDEAGMDSDTLTIVLDDRDNQIAIPPTGAELSFAIGLANSQTQGLINKGLFTVDETFISGPSYTLTISAKAADMGASLKERRTRSWTHITLGALVQSIAGAHKLKPGIAPNLAQVSFEHIAQTNESDFHLLTRLSKDNDAIVKVANGHLIMAPKGQAKSVSGKSLPVINITPKDISRIELTQADRGKYTKVIAHWHDTKTGEKKPVSVGDGTPAFTIRRVYRNKDIAARESARKLEALKRGEAFGNVDIVLDEQSDDLSQTALSLSADAKLALSQFRSEINGAWSVSRVTTTLANQGISVACDFEVPNKT